MTKAPLADQIRPQSLKEFIGQRHLVGPNKPLRLAIKKDKIHSMVFWGPPGSGKTSLAKVIAEETESEFIHLSAVSSGKADIKKIVTQIRETPLIDKKTILFLDEIHRFNKAQQDFLLPYVEDNTIILVGATTENPSFSIISPLLSRCQVFVLDSLTKKELSQIIDKGKQVLKVRSLSAVAEDFLIEFANGDARQALNLLETTVKLYQQVNIKNLKLALQSKFLRYDRAGEEHYNTISSYIKSMRAGNVDAALYYLARMVDAGEDPLFIARRMVVFASEDVASPTAIVVADAVFRACETIGYPECQENLAAGTVYLAKAEKDRRAYGAYMKALGDVKKYGNLQIPLHLRNAPTKLMEKLNYGKGYQMYPDKNKSLLPDKLKDKKYYETGKS